MNLIKSIFSRTFDNPFTLTNTVFIAIVLIILIIGGIYTLGATYSDFLRYVNYCKKLIELFRLRNLKSTFFKTLNHIGNLFVAILFGVIIYIVLFCISLVLFIISTIWVEYPGYNGFVYTRDGGQWNKHEGRVHHFPFGFDGCTVSKRDHSGTISLEDVFKIQYHINESDGSMQTVLKNLDSITTSMIFQDIEKLIRKKYKKLIFSTNHKDLLDPEIRLKIFQDFYKPYGITVDSVDML